MRAHALVLAFVRLPAPLALKVISMLGVISASVAISAFGAISAPAATIPSLLTAALRARLQASAVPVLLPIPAPPAIGPVRSIAVIGADHSGYYVALSPVAQCGGALSCAFFHVAGYRDTGSLDHSYRRERRVRLPDGRPGYYQPADCSGASCSEASLLFERRGAVYEIDAKVGGDNLATLKGAYRSLRLVR